MIVENKRIFIDRVPPWGDAKKTERDNGYKLTTLMFLDGQNGKRSATSKETWRLFDEFERRCLATGKDTVATNEGLLGGTSPVATLRIEPETGESNGCVAFQNIYDVREMLTAIAEKGAILFSADDVSMAERLGLLAPALSRLAKAWVDPEGVNGVVII